MGKFKEGNEVQLKTGGPKMVVDTIDQLDRYWCKWYNGKEFVTEVFNEDSLKPASPDEGPSAS